MSLTYYTISGSSYVERSDGVIIPNDTSDPDWNTYLAWVAQGNTAGTNPNFPTNPVINVPMWAAQYVMSTTSYTSSQAQPTYQTPTASCTNLLDAANIVIPLIANNKLTIFWNKATVVSSNNSLLLGLGVNLGLNTSQVYSLFQTAQGVSI